MAERKQSKTTTTTKKCLRVILQHAPPLRQTELIAMLPNRAEPLSITIKLHELAVLGETFMILWATFQACVGCDRWENTCVMQTLVDMMGVNAMSV